MTDKIVGIVNEMVRKSRKLNMYNVSIDFIFRDNTFFFFGLCVCIDRVLKLLLNLAGRPTDVEIISIRIQIIKYALVFKCLGKYYTITKKNK